MSIAALKQQMQELCAERSRAVAFGLDADEDYMTDLAAELEECRHAYVCTAVAAIASLRAELGAPLAG